MDPNKSCPKTLGMYYKHDGAASACMYDPSGKLNCGLQAGQTGDKLILKQETWSPNFKALVKEQARAWNDDSRH
jgi:hypothetical protein